MGRISVDETNHPVFEKQEPPGRIAKGNTRGNLCHGERPCLLLVPFSSLLASREDLSETTEIEHRPKDARQAELPD